MFTTAKIRNGSTYLDHHLTSNDYYAEGEEVVGRWQGELAARLGLFPDQRIHRGDRAFQRLRENDHPTDDRKLTQRTVKGGVRFFDFQCSAQKSVSLMHGLMGDERLARAHDRAAAKAFVELEKLAACRERSGDAAWSEENRHTGNLCAATFRHTASRALDPHLHTHFVVANATWDAHKGRMLALESCEMFKAIRYVGKVYQNELAREVQRLGYEIDEKRNDKGMIEGFEIRGVSSDLLERFAKRRDEIERGIAKFETEHGRSPSRAEISRITRDTRDAKLVEISTSEVHAEQLRQLSSEEAEILRSLKLQAMSRATRPARQPPTADTSDQGGQEFAALAAAVAHLYERASVLSGHAILAETLNHGLGALNLEVLQRKIAAGSAGLVSLEQGKGPPVLSTRYATDHGLKLERWSTEVVNGTKGIHAPLLAVGSAGADWLAEEQQEAVRFVGASSDQIMAIRGVAGAGKTTLLKALDAQLNQAGHRLLYLAPMAAAVRVLASEGFTHSTTVSEYLVRSQDGEMPDAWRNAIVVVDEAGLASNQQGAALLERALRSNQRIVFVGDSRQHSSVAAGDFLRVLEAHSQIASCEIREIRRQVHAEYKMAVQLMARGQAAAGMAQLEHIGWIHEQKDHYLQAAADEYLRLSQMATSGKTVLCVAPTWRELTPLTEHIRIGLRAAGQLGEATETKVLESMSWTAQQRGTARNYRPGMMITFNRRVRGGFVKDQSYEVERVERDQVFLTGNRRLDLTQAKSFDVFYWRKLELAAGDRILVRRNDKKRKLINGQVFTVRHILPDGTIETVEGKVLPSGFVHYTHGYVMTSHKSQGSTADHVVVAAERLDAKSAYVACSRGRQTCAVFTPDKEHLFAHIPGSADREAALDVLRERTAERKRTTHQNTIAIRGERISPEPEKEIRAEENILETSDTEATSHEDTGSKPPSESPTVIPPTGGLGRRGRSR